VNDPRKVAEVLAEEIRTNGELRRQLGMSEGSDSGLVDDAPAIGIATDEGEFFIEVTPA
jgi:hypothetical protein